MLTQENEYYIRLILLTLRGGTLVLRQIFIKKLADQNIQLDGFLQINKEAIKQLKDSKVLTLKQYNILFPHNDTMPDICKLDISLLSCLLLNLFVPSLQKSDEKAIENIRTLRNDFTAHHPDGCIDARKFFRKWNQLSTSIMNLGKGLCGEESSALAEIINCVGEDPIDIKRATQYIRDENGTMDQFIEHVSLQLERLSLDVQDTRTDIKTLEMEVKNFIIQNGNIDISTVIVGEVTVSGRNPEAVTEAAATLIAHAKRSKGFVERLSSALESSRQGMTNIISSAFTRVKGFFSSQNLALTQDEQSASQRCVTSLVQDIRRAGGEVIDATEGSVLLHIRCHSVDVLLSVLDYFNSTVLEQRLKDIAEYLTEETGSQIYLSACIQIESLQEAFQNIHEKQSNMFTKRVRFSIKCRDAEGVLNVVNLFEGSKMSDNIFTLSNSLSSEVGGPVTLRTSVDSYTVQEYIKEARDKQKETDQSVTRLESEKEAGARRAPQSIFTEETDQPFVKEDLSTPAESSLSWLANKFTRFLPGQSYKNGIKLLQKGEKQYEFVAFLLYCDYDEDVSRFVIDKLNTTLTLLTGMEKNHICTADKYFLPGSNMFEEYIRCLERSAIVVVIVPYFADELCTRMKDADAFGKQIVPIIFGGSINEPFFKGFTNLSNVTLLLKKEYDEYTVEPEWTEFCTKIIQLISNSGVKVMSYDRKYRSKLRASDIGRHVFKMWTQSFSTTKSYIRLLLRNQLHKTYMKRLWEENEDEFIALLHYEDYDEDEAFLGNIVLRKLNETLQSLTGIDRNLICRHERFEGTLQDHISEYEIWLAKSTVLIVFVTKHFRQNLRWISLKMADNHGIEIVPIMFEGEEEYAMSVLKGIRNLSEVRIILKIENGKYLLKTSWMQVCKDILEIAASSDPYGGNISEQMMETRLFQ